MNSKVKFLYIFLGILVVGGALVFRHFKAGHCLYPITYSKAFIPHFSTKIHGQEILFAIDTGAMRSSLPAGTRLNRSIVKGLNYEWVDSFGNTYNSKVFNVPRFKFGNKVFKNHYFFENSDLLICL